MHWKEGKFDALHIKHLQDFFDLNSAIFKWNYFVKIVAAPADAYAEGGAWYTTSGVEIGPAIWGAFAIIQEVENDACAGLHGLQYISPVHSGLGNW